jgi:hypothetical protein
VRIQAVVVVQPVGYTKCFQSIIEAMAGVRSLHGRIEICTLGEIDQALDLALKIP